MEAKEETQILPETDNAKHQYFKTKYNHTGFMQRQFLVTLQSLQYTVTAKSLFLKKHKRCIYKHKLVDKIIQTSSSTSCKVHDVNTKISK
jgi:hypothetical protein